MLLSLGLHFAIAASSPQQLGSVTITAGPAGTVATAPDIGRVPLPDELNEIGKQCQIGVWGDKDSVIVQGLEPEGQEKRYDRARSCASHLIKRAGYKGAILVD